MRHSILFLCTGNSCRSQMAEAFARHHAPAECLVASAGLEKHGLNPYMLRVMEESGVSMESHTSKTIAELPARQWDLIVTVCDHAEKNCPYLPARQHLHMPFLDPPALANGLQDDAEIMEIYRRVRDDIRASIQTQIFSTPHRARLQSAREAG